MRITTRLASVGSALVLALTSTLLGSSARAVGPPLVVGVTDPETCQWLIVTDRASATEPLTIVLSTGYNGRGAPFEHSGELGGLWARLAPVQKLALGQDTIGITLKRGTTIIGTGEGLVSQECLTPGLYPAKGRPSTPTGRIGDASGSAHADLWMINELGNVTYVEWDAVDRSFFSEPRFVGAGLTDISAMNAITDKNGDRRADFLVRHKSDASLWFYYNLGNGHLRKGIQVGRYWNSMDQIFYAGTMVAGSSTEYVLARRATDGTLWRYQLTSGGLTNGTQVGSGWGSMRFMLSPGSMWGDAAWDVVGIRKDGLMFGYRVVNGKLVSVGEIGHGWNGMAMATVPGDLNNDGRLDLVAVNAEGELYGYVNTTTGFSGLGVVGFSDESYPATAMA